MVLDEADGVISFAEQHLANTLAQSSAFQTWVGAANSTDAADHIFFTALPFPTDNEKYTPEELKTIYPCALIYTEAFSGSTLTRTGIMVAQGSGVIAFALEEVVPESIQDEYAAVERSWKNTVGKIMSDVIAYSRTGGCLDATTVVNTELYRHDKDARVFLDTNYAVCAVSWGTQQ